MVTALTVMVIATTVTEAIATMNPGDTGSVVKESIVTETVIGIVKGMVAAGRSSMSDLHERIAGESLAGGMKNLEVMDVANVKKTTAVGVVGSNVKAWEHLSEDLLLLPKRRPSPSEGGRQVAGTSMLPATNSTPPCRRSRRVCGLVSSFVHSI